MPVWTAQTRVLHQMPEAAADCIHADPSLHKLGDGRCMESEDGLLLPFLFIPNPSTGYHLLAFAIMPSCRTAKGLVRPTS